jgi:hypothetical protein
MAVTVRQVSLEVIFAGVDLTNAAGYPADPSGTGVVLSARGEVAADSGWPTCSVFVTHKPATGNEEDTLTVVAGAGNNVTRFTGRVRRFRPSGFPKSIEMVAMGTLAYAAEWAQPEDIEFEEVFPSGATDEELVRWALDYVPGITYTSGNIAGTGTTFGTEAPEVFNWRAGVSAWSYIQQLDRATLYRTYQTRDGTIRRVRMIGHPDETEDFTLTNDDVLDGATGNRDTERTRNNVRVVGHDYGDGAGPVLATATGTPIPGTPDRWEDFSSDLIEDGNDEDGTPLGYGGLDAQDLADQIILDVNKEFVEASVPSWRDDTHGPGLTCLLDTLDRLAIGEPMWVARHAWEVGDNGWMVTYGLTGGGLPQDYVPPPV